MKNLYLFIIIFSSFCFGESLENKKDCSKVVTENIQELEICAKQKDSFSQYNLAVMYKEGVNIERDFKKSFYWFKQAALANVVQAKTNLSWFFENGVAVEQDFNQAFYWAKQAADENEPIALNNLGTYYQKGIGVKVDLNKAVQYFELALDKEPTLPIAKINLSYAYFYGLGVDKSAEKAIHLIQDLANQNDELAMTNLGMFYNELNYGELAFLWTKKAAEKGNSLAQTNLGLFYAKGIGVDIDKREAISWLNKAMAQNESQAFFIMATLYANKNSILGLDEQKAFNLYMKSAELGNGNAQNNLANWFFNGRFVPRNEKEGLKWYLKAAEENNIAVSMYTLYQIYLKGTKEIPQDLEKAKYWLEKAKENGFNLK